MGSSLAQRSPSHWEKLGEDANHYSYNRYNSCENVLLRLIYVI